VSSATADEATAFVRAETARMARLVREAGIRAEP
jgi:tripartite-type tricarboxylate transporter receptor subunit TctC